MSMQLSVISGCAKILKKNLQNFNFLGFDRDRGNQWCWFRISRPFYCKIIINLKYITKIGQNWCFFCEEMQPVFSFWKPYLYTLMKQHDQKCRHIPTTLLKDVCGGDNLIFVNHFAFLGPTTWGFIWAMNCQKAGGYCCCT